MKRTSRARLVAPLLAAAAAGLAVAVQRRDTPLRRWLLPPRESPAAAKLRATMPDVRIDGLALDRTLAEIGRLAGLGVEFDPSTAKLRLDERVTTDLRLTGVTAAEAFDAALRQQCGTDVPLVAAVDGRVVIAAEDAPRWGVVVRAYEVAGLLPPPGPVVVRGSDRESTYQPVPPPIPRTDRQEAGADLVRLVEGLVPELPAAGPARSKAGDDGRVRLWGDRLYVVGSPPVQERVAAYLRILPPARRGTEAVADPPP